MSPESNSDIEAIILAQDELEKQLEAGREQEPWSRPAPLQYLPYGGGVLSAAQKKRRAKAKRAKQSRKKNRKK